MSLAFLLACSQPKPIPTPEEDAAPSTSMVDEMMPEETPDAPVYEGPLRKLPIKLADLSEAQRDSLQKLWGVHHYSSAYDSVYANDSTIADWSRLFVGRLTDQELVNDGWFYQGGALRINYWEHHLLDLPTNSGFDPTYSGYSSTKSAPEQLFSMLPWRFDRSPEALQESWESFQSLIYLTLSAFEYEDNNFEGYVDALILTHDSLASNPEMERILDDLAEQTENRTFEGYEATNTMIPIFEPYVPAKVLYDYGYREAIDGAVSDEVFHSHHTPNTIWFVSFWMRRHLENNREVVYAILKDIQAHYAN